MSTIFTAQAMSSTEDAFLSLSVPVPDPWTCWCIALSIMQSVFYCGRVQRLLFQPRTFKLKVTESTFNDETNVKKNIIASSPMNFVNENKVRLRLRPDVVWNHGLQLAWHMNEFLACQRYMLVHLMLCLRWFAADERAGWHACGSSS